MIKAFNLLRYLAAIVGPVIVAFMYGIIPGVLCVITVLFLNNLLDDIVFYYGSAFVNTGRYYGGIPSPVNGIVTQVEYGVPMYHHITKTDVLTKEEILNAVHTEDTCKLYNHVTIFLNKLNKHIVASIGDLVSMRSYTRFEGDDSMVESGELIAKNTGEYLKNTFVELEYRNGVRVIVTMDKYISRAVLSESDCLEMLICRGSQCDMYMPERFPINVVQWQNVDIYQTVSSKTEYCKKKDSFEIFKEVMKCIKESGFNVTDAIVENLDKTLSTTTYNRLFVWVILCALLVNHQASLMALFVYMYLFVFDRSVKNLMYSLMNVIGYKPFMTTIYKAINKITVYGK